MDDRKHNSVEPWGDWEYGTGCTCPPRDHTGLVTVLLVLVILLCSVVSVLGVLNIRMFQKLNRHEEQEDSISFAEETEATAESQPTAYAGRVMPDMTMQLQQSPEVHTQTGALSLQEIYTRNIPSVVSISCTLSSGTASGSGVVLSKLGYLVTNAHVIEGAKTISALLTDGRELTASVVGTDTVSDLAVLHVDADDLTEAQFGDSDSLRVGDTVVAIGDPLGVDLRGTMTDGIISAINRDVQVRGVTMNLIQTNAALNSGNSGGPLINSYGQVVGINTMKIGAFTDKSGVEGLGFAIPSATVMEIVNQLISQGYVSGRPWLGIKGENFSSFYQRFYRVPAGLYITEVQPGSPAAEAGIVAGDILTRIDGESVSTMEALNNLLYAHQVGDSLSLVIYRAQGQATVTVTLTENKG